MCKSNSKFGKGKQQSTEQTGFKKNLQNFVDENFENLKSFRHFSDWLHRPVDGAALGVFRTLFGAAMLIDIAEERGGGQLDLKFGDPRQCHFPLFSFIKEFPLPLMGIVMGIMWLGALGITLGYRFKWSCLAFIIPYWYIFLLDKPTWNNHSYLFGLCGSILLLTKANHYCSLDKLLDPEMHESIVPYWNYFLIKFQFFILYTFAGMKKFTAEWLSGYAMSSLGHHWLFIPFRTILTVEMIDLLVVHWFTAIFDFSIAMLMTWKETRKYSTPFMMCFHLMNSRLFVIGMFPWVCLAEVPLFFSFDAPRKILAKIKSTKIVENVKQTFDGSSKNDKIGPKIATTFVNWKKKMATIGILIYCALQCFLPYSHFITKGYNNWTNGLYGYSWDMMVHTYDSILTTIKIVDNKNEKVHYLDPFAFTDYDRWTKYADMAVQYAKCIEKNILTEYGENSVKGSPLISKNISIYYDIWCSMNGRFQQRIFDPRVDLLKAPWSPFEKTPWLLPLLNELNHMRPKLIDITNDVLSWNNYSDVIFVADFPGLTLDNFIAPDLANITLTVLEGKIHFNNENDRKEGIILTSGQRISPKSGESHYVTTIGDQPSSYFYTYINRTMQDAGIVIDNGPEFESKKPILPLWKEFQERIENYKRFLANIGNSIMFLFYGVPFPVSVRERGN